MADSWPAAASRLPRGDAPRARERPAGGAGGFALRAGVARGAAGDGGALPRPRRRGAGALPAARHAAVRDLDGDRARRAGAGARAPRAGRGALRGTARAARGARRDGRRTSRRCRSWWMPTCAWGARTMPPGSCRSWRNGPAPRGSPGRWPVRRAVAASWRPDSELDEHFGEALALHELTPDLFEAARTRLAYGARLRRARKRVRAREELRAALELFDRLGATPWAEQASAELRATGETARRRDPSTLDELTPRSCRSPCSWRRGRPRARPRRRCSSARRRSSTTCATCTASSGSARASSWLRRSPVDASGRQSRIGSRRCCSRRSPPLNDFLRLHPEAIRALRSGT